MDNLDRKILEVLQDAFPLSEKPYEIMAEKLGISADDLFARIIQLEKEGVIRRIGASLDSRKLDFASTLAAVSVKPDMVDKADKVIGKFPDVTHSSSIIKKA